MKAEYDPAADALYITLHDVDCVDRTDEAEPGTVNVDWAQGLIVGIEVLAPTMPLRLADVAHRYGFSRQIDDIYALAGMALGMKVSGAGVLTKASASSQQEAPDA